MFYHLETLPNGFAGGLMLFFAFAIWHALADFPLQGEFLSRAKIRGADLSDIFGGNVPKGIWFHALTAHCLIHAGAVWAVSGSAQLGALEFILHWVIDYAKGAGKTSFHVDQSLHLLCKLGYVVALLTVPHLCYSAAG